MFQSTNWEAVAHYALLHRTIMWFFRPGRGSKIEKPHWNGVFFENPCQTAESPSVR